MFFSLSDALGENSLVCGVFEVVEVGFEAVLHEDVLEFLSELVVTFTLLCD